MRRTSGDGSAYGMPIDLLGMLMDAADDAREPSCSIAWTREPKPWAFSRCFPDHINE